ncbi:DNA-directed RNA polymerase subunit alpha C-terminal domain-containing protein [Yinghuangia aomiensis]
MYGLGVNTVGDLLAYSQRQLVNAPGLGAKTRKEVQQRLKQWRELLATPVDGPLTPKGRKAAGAELKELSDAESALADALVGAGSSAGVPERALRSVSLDTLATVFVPELKKDESNRNECEMVRLLLRLPDGSGVLPDMPVWPKQKDVADELGLTAGRIPQMLKSQRTRWKKHPAVQALRAEILELLHGLGRVASAAEIADTLAVRRGTELPAREQRRALALAALRAVVEVEQLVPDEAEFRHAPNRDADDDGIAAGLLALEVRDDDAPDTASAPGLLDYVQRLGKVADRLAKLETLPTAATVLTELGAVAPPSTTVEWDDRRLVELAAAASRTAAATPRLEIYPRKLDFVRALRLTQAGLVRPIPGVPQARQPGVTAAEIHDRVRARFPELLYGPRGEHALPTGGPLTHALREAGFDLELATREDTGTLRYVARGSGSDSSLRGSLRLREATGMSAPNRYVDDPQLAAAVEAEERLTVSARRDGFRVLTARIALAVAAVGELTGSRFGSEPVSVTDLFVQAMRDQLDPDRPPTWDTILKADAAPAGSRGALKFAEYALTAWGVVEPLLAERLSSGDTKAPLLLTDAVVFARYDAMGSLERLADLSRQGGRGLWLVCPQNDPARPPRLGSTRGAVPGRVGRVGCPAGRVGAERASC